MHLLSLILFFSVPDSTSITLFLFHLKCRSVVLDGSEELSYFGFEYYRKLKTHTVTGSPSIASKSLQDLYTVDISVCGLLGGISL